MIEIDHSVVYRRHNGKGGSGTAVHFSATCLVLEVYEKETAIHLNEVFSRIRISHGRSIMYDGNGIVRHVMDYSSLQIIDLYLMDPWIALSSEDLDADNRFEVERFLDLYENDAYLDFQWTRCFFRFIQLLSQMLDGLKIARRRGNGASSARSFLSNGNGGKKDVALDLMADKLYQHYLEFEKCMNGCDENDHVQVDALFKQLLFPLSRHSRIFRLFHATNRIPYLNYKKLEWMRKDRVFWRGGLRGVLMDLFFLKFIGAETIEQRCSYFVDKVQSVLDERKGDIKILLIGTDFTSFQIIERLPVSSLTRLNIEVISFFEEPVTEFLEHISVASAKKGIGIRFEYNHVCLESLIRDHFCASGSCLTSYDQIYISSAVESLSEKMLPYLIHYLAGHLNQDGEISLFTTTEETSSVCEHWLQWYTRPLDNTEWERLLPTTIMWKQEKMECGSLVEICRNTNPQ
jgi:hypothetical protein